jgi:hypothetical protein
VIEREWREYRAMSVPRDAPPHVAEALMLAFYAGAATALTELALGDDQDKTARALVDEVAAFTALVEHRRAAPR